MLNIFFNKNVSNRLSLIIAGVTFLILLCTSSVAQNNDSIKKVDSTKTFITNKTITPRSPRKAALLSTALPGLGQAYNKKYWKIPVIYVGLGALAYSFDYNHKKYVTYRNAYRDRIDTSSATIDPFINIYSNDQLVKLYQFYHRYRDLSAIGIGVVYVFNIFY